MSKKIGNLAMSLKSKKGAAKLLLPSGDEIIIAVTEVRGNHVSLLLKAPIEVKIIRINDLGGTIEKDGKTTEKQENGNQGQ